MDRQIILEKIDTLKLNRQAGQEQLRQLDEQARQLHATVTRIDGAIAVLEDLLRELPAE